ncbi:MAG: DUF3667 domain-containing protein [Bacteroidia bacterium]|nr:DUF3667 domain-containing protein [Bacteroidia bacterium]
MHPESQQPLAEPAAPASHTCANCAAVFTGAYCNTCGQEFHEGPFTVRGLILHAVHDRLHDIRMFLQTSWNLIRRPGTVIREYLAGRRKAHYNAINYLLVIASFSAAAALLNRHSLDESVAAMEESYRQMGMPESSVSQQRTMRMYVWMQQNYNILMLAALPFMALAQRMIFRRRGLTLGEHFLSVCYLYGFFALATLPTLPFINLGNLADSMYGLSMLVMLAYFAWGYRDWLGLGWGKAMLRSVQLFVLYVVLLMGFTVAVSIPASLIILLVKRVFGI